MLPVRIQRPQNFRCQYLTLHLFQRLRHALTIVEDQ